MSHLQTSRLKDGETHCWLILCVWDNVIDEARCSTPRSVKGFQLKCIWHECSKSQPGEDCIGDKFVGLQANVSYSAKGFNLTWDLFGPGKPSGVRVNITEVNDNMHMYTHLIHPEITTDSFMDAKPNRTYDICIEVMVPKESSTPKKCFVNISYSADSGILASRREEKYLRWVQVLGTLTVLFLLLFAAMLVIHICHRRKATSETHSIEGGFQERAQSKQNKDQAKSSFLVRLLRTIRRSTQRYEEPRDAGSVPLTLLSPENEEGYIDPATQAPENTTEDEEDDIYEYEPTQDITRPCVDPIASSRPKVSLFPDDERASRPLPILPVDAAVSATYTNVVIDKKQTPVDYRTSVSENQDIDMRDMNDEDKLHITDLEVPNEIQDRSIAHMEASTISESMPSIPDPLPDQTSPQTSPFPVQKNAEDNVEYKTPNRVTPSVGQMYPIPVGSFKGETTKPRAHVHPVLQQPDTSAKAEARPAEVQPLLQQPYPSPETLETRSQPIHVPPLIRQPETSTEVEDENEKPKPSRRGQRDRNLDSGTIFVNPRLASDSSDSYSSVGSSPNTNGEQVFLSIGLDNPNYDSCSGPYSGDQTIPKTVSDDQQTIPKKADDSDWVMVDLS